MKKKIFVIIQIVIVSLSFSLFSCQKMSVEKSELYLGSNSVILPIDTYNLPCVTGALKVLIDGYIYQFIFSPNGKQNYISSSSLKKMGMTSNEIKKKKFVDINSIIIGKSEFKNMKFKIFVSQNSTMNADGYIGSDFFSNYENITIDFATNRLILDDNVLNENLTPYKTDGDFFLIKSNKKKIGIITFHLTNIFKEKSYIDQNLEKEIDLGEKKYKYYRLEDVSLTSQGIKDVLAITYSNCEEGKDYQLKSLSSSKKYDAILGTPCLLHNTLTINFKEKLLGFNKSTNTEPLPKKEVNEKCSYCEKLKYKKKELPKKMTIPLIIQTSDKNLKTRAFVDVEIQNRRLRLLLDTGCAQSWLYPTGIAKAGIKTIDNESSYKVYLEQMEIGNCKMNNVDFYIDYKTILDYKVDGLLGLDFFKGADSITIDYKNKILEVSNKYPEGESIPIIYQTGGIYLDNIEIQNKKYIAKLDTGSTMSSIKFDGKLEKSMNYNSVSLYGNIFGQRNYGTVDCKIDKNHTYDIQVWADTTSAWNTLWPCPLYAEAENINMNMLLGSYGFFDRYKVTIDFNNLRCWIE